MNQLILLLLAGISMFATDKIINPKLIIDLSKEIIVENSKKQFKRIVTYNISLVE